MDKKLAKKMPDKYMDEKFIVLDEDGDMPYSGTSTEKETLDMLDDELLDADGTESVFRVYKLVKLVTLKKQFSKVVAPVK